MVGLALNCGKDPILEAAENLEKEENSVSVQNVGEEDQPTPGVEEGEPEPGIPEDPEPAPPAASGPFPGASE